MKMKNLIPLALVLANTFSASAQNTANNFSGCIELKGNWEGLCDYRFFNPAGDLIKEVKDVKEELTVKRSTKDCKVFEHDGFSIEIGNTVAFEPTDFGKGTVDTLAHTFLWKTDGTILREVFSGSMAVTKSGNHFLQIANVTYSIKNGSLVVQSQVNRFSSLSEAKDHKIVSSCKLNKI